jgi:hypothetical protein
MKARLLFDRRVVVDEHAFAELVAWRLAKPLPGSRHRFTYRLAFVVARRCVVRYDNETGKGDHRHFDEKETVYVFSTVDRLVADFLEDVTRWRNENRNP